MKKRRVLLDFSGSVSLFSAGIMGLCAGHFELEMTEEVRIIFHLNEIKWMQELDALTLGRNSRIRLVKSGLDAKKLEEAVDRTGAYLGNLPEVLDKAEYDSMIAYHEKNCKSIDYVLYGALLRDIGGMAVGIRKRGGIVVSPYELALLLYHDGKLERKKLREMLQL